MLSWVEHEKKFYNFGAKTFAVEYASKVCFRTTEPKGRDDTLFILIIWTP